MISSFSKEPDAKEVKEIEGPGEQWWRLQDPEPQHVYAKRIREGVSGEE